MIRVLRFILGSLLITHISWLALSPELNRVRDLYLYNSIWLLALILVISAPLTLNRVAMAAIALAIFFWGIGSLASTLDGLSNQLPQYGLITQLCYTLFYPLMVIAIPRISSNPTRLRPLEVLDAVIFGVGFTSLISTVLFTFVFPSNQLAQSDDFFTLFYPVGDLALLFVIAIQIATKGFSIQLTSLALGITLFALSDIYYLWLNFSDRYLFGTVQDDGWLLAIVIIGISSSFESKSSFPVKPIHPALVALSIFISPILLAISALSPELFPQFMILLLIGNLLLAFIRMSTALREARLLSNERSLARTDELTGLANRRRLLSEINQFAETEGALMLLDLDGFKPINDTYGHDAGDLVLREVAKRFSRVLSNDCMLARLGGDEFGVLIRGSHDEVIESAYALRACLSYPFSIRGEHISIDVSIGLVHNDGRGELLKRADNAMYRAKQTGMGVVHS